MVTQQSPAEKIAEQVAEKAPGLTVAAYTEAIDNFRRANDSYRKRLADSHRWHAKALGMEASDTEGDDVGNLVVTGDVYGSDAASIIAALQGSQQASPQGGQQETLEPPATSPPVTAPPSTMAPAATSPAATGTSNFAKAAIVAAGLLGGSALGAGIPWLAGAYSKPPAVNTTTVQQVPATRLGVEVVPGGAANK